MIHAKGYKVQDFLDYWQITRRTYDNYCANEKMHDNTNYDINEKMIKIACESNISMILIISNLVDYLLSYCAVIIYLLSWLQVHSQQG